MRKNTSYNYKGVEYSSIEELAKAQGVSTIFLDITLDEERSVDEAIRDAKEMSDMLDEICDDLNEEQERKNREFDMCMGL